MIKLKILLKGRVQGVFFRISTKKTAEKLNISGWVRNLSTGEVEISAVGSPKKIKEFTKWLKTGPKLARVDKLKILFKQKTNKASGKFLIRPDA
jgi:acylphosphatase